MTNSNNINDKNYIETFYQSFELMKQYQHIADDLSSQQRYEEAKAIAKLALEADLNCTISLSQLFNGNPEYIVSPRIVQDRNYLIQQVLNNWHREDSEPAELINEKMTSLYKDNDKFSSLVQPIIDYAEKNLLSKGEEDSNYYGELDSSGDIEGYLSDYDVVAIEVLG